MGKVKVVFSRMCWDDEYYVDMASGNGFEISEPSEITLDGRRGKTMYGADSPLYGTTYGDEQEFAERFRCECGQMMSRQFEGQICPVCHTPVKHVPVNLEMTGWICLGDKKIIHPYYYNYITKIFGKTDFPDMVKRVRSVDRDGQLKDIVPEDFDMKATSPFYAIGTQAFYDRYDEILDYYAMKKPARADAIDLLKMEKHKVFTSHIPIYSTMLRPNSSTADTLYFTSIEKLINTLFSLSQSVKDCSEIDEDLILTRIQQKVNAMWDTNFDLLNGKTGFIREDMLGGDLNHTSRNVIIPDPELKIDEVTMSYPAFRELFKFKIIHYIQKFYDCDLSVALTMWEKSITFDKGVYEIMNMILREEGARIILNRNPTLNFYSLLRMKIRDIVPSSSNYTLGVNLSILPGLNADFDGDILNIIALVDPTFTEIFRNFDPKERMILDRDTGELNGLFGPGKDSMNNLYAFAMIGATKNDTPQSSTCPEFLDYCKRHGIRYRGVVV